jgi:hypothetical protein
MILNFSPFFTILIAGEEFFTSVGEQELRKSNICIKMPLRLKDAKGFVNLWILLPSWRIEFLILRKM